jgi:hypothetical protein
MLGWCLLEWDWGALLSDLETENHGGRIERVERGRYCTPVPARLWGVDLVLMTRFLHRQKQRLLVELRNAPQSYNWADTSGISCVSATPRWLVIFWCTSLSSLFFLVKRLSSPCFRALSPCVQYRSALAQEYISPYVVSFCNLLTSDCSQWCKAAATSTPYKSVNSAAMRVARVLKVSWRRVAYLRWRQNCTAYSSKIKASTESSLSRVSVLLQPRRQAGL